MTFPYTGWVLMPSFKPVKTIFVEAARYSEGWHKSEGGKTYSTQNIYATKDAAISAGHIDLHQQQAALDKKQANINKRRAALEKAAGESKP